MPAASVIGEAVVAFEIANAFIDKFSGDSVDEIIDAVQKWYSKQEIVGKKALPK